MGRQSDDHGGVLSSVHSTFGHDHQRRVDDEFAMANLNDLEATPTTMETTASQKMLSAMTGSLITSLLGK